MIDTLERSDELIQIERFAGEDAEAASEAFTVLAPKIRAVVTRLLANSLPRSVDREDVAETVLQRLWQNRSRFEARSIAAWWKYVGVTARRCALDQWSPEVSVEVDDAIVDPAASVFPMDLSRIFDGADELWLGVESTLSRRERNRRLLAAQLYVLHGRSLEESAAVVGAGLPELERWVRCKSVLLRLGYSHLYQDNDRLAAHLLLVKDGPTGLDRIASLARAAEGKPPAGWTWTEVQIVILRIRNGLTESKIAQLLGREIGEVERVSQVCLKHFPFLTRARELKKKLRARGLETRMLSSIDLWRRLAFQYYAADDLPHRQILERTSEPAEVSGYGLNAGILNAWLSNRRILNQLLEHLNKEERDA